MVSRVRWEGKIGSKDEWLSLCLSPVKNPIFIPKNRKLVKEQRVVNEGKPGKPLVQQTIGSFSLRSATREDKLIPQICLGARR